MFPTMRPSFLLILALLSLADCAATQPAGQQADAKTPGWTGRTVVIGSNSTVAGDAAATYDQQKWPRGRR